MRRFGPIGGALLLASLLLAGPAGCQDGSALSALQSGEYEEAIRLASEAIEDEPTDAASRSILVRALLDTGRYEDAIVAAASLPNLRGEALRSVGRLAEAEAAFEEAAEAGGPDQLTAEFNLAEMLFNRGEKAEAMSRFDAFIDVYNASSDASAEDLSAVGNAVWYLGTSEPELFPDVVLAFDEAIAANPRNVEPHIRMGELFLEKYNSPEAQAVLDEALQINPNHPRALLGMAKAKAFDGQQGEAMELVRRALEVNPNLVPARAFVARMSLDTDDYQTARTELTRALEVNPASLEALSTLAAMHFVRGEERQYREVRSRVEQLNPVYSGLLTTVAEVAAQQRRYAEAAGLAAEATSLDPESWASHAVLGLNQFRLGRIEEARSSLETSFAGDPYNVWIKNNLDLLDTFGEYELVTLPGFELMLHKDEAEVLRPYIEFAAAQAHATLTERYGDRPRGRVRIELYPRSADFSVRTVGLAGMGALGVSFGDVLALDSPSAREAGSYNWLTTLWHELGHTIALGVSNNRVPRWFTEGLSTLDERLSQPRWEPSIIPEFLKMYDEGELPPVSRLNEGFIRPETPQHLSSAYIMASLVGQWIEETRGFEAIVEMLHGYRDGRGTDEIFRSVLRAEPAAIDAEFDRWLRARADPANIDRWEDLYEHGRAQFEEENFAAAKPLLEEAAALFPVSGGRGSPFTILAQIHLREGNKRAAADALLKLTARDETAYAENLELARLLEEFADSAGAAAALERAVWISPFEVAPHTRLAELYQSLGQLDLVVRERRALLGLNPPDRAEALYQLALAYQAAGDIAGARREVLRALEAAPAFEAAQQLLLRLHEGT